ncbi:MAG: hypothetical protein WA123_12170, partial [Methylotenera sp.]
MKISHLIMVAGLFVLGVSTPVASNETKPIDAWIRPVKEGWAVKPLLNVGDHVGKTGYRMVGVPDGLGALDNGDGTLSVFMNHELASDMGKLRRHSGRGAFVSRWVLDIDTLKMLDGGDQIRKVELWLPEEHRHI